jgi:hypothetical protein
MATPAHPCLPETNTAETKTSEDKETRRKPVTHKQDFLPFCFSKKLTRGGCMMPRSANAKASCDVLFTQAALEHMSSSSPSTRLFSLCNRSHSLQAWQASRLTESPGTRASCTWVLVSASPGLEKEGWMRERGHGDILTATSHWRSGGTL